MSGGGGTCVVFVEDDPPLREAMLQSLRLEGLAVEAHERAAPALRALSPEFPGVVVSDIRLPGMDGLEFFAAIRALDPELPVIFTTGHGDVEMAVGAMKQGAADFLAKPYSPSALIEAIGRAAEKRALVLENRKLRTALRDRESPGLIGSSDRVRRLEVLLGEVARTDIDIVLTGPGGVGKTFVAKRIHELSPRAARPFVSIDAGIWTHPDAELIIFGRDPSERLSRSGLIERAQGGTLLLDNFDTAPLALHGRIASLLETRSYRALGADRPRTADVRIVAAGTDKTGAATSGVLRHLGGIAIALPPLAERREDISAIFRYFVAHFEAEAQAASRPLRANEWQHLLGSDWPGNIRELRDFARNYVHGLTDYENATLAPEPGARSLAALVLAFERTVLVDALTQHRGRIARVEGALGIKRKTLYDKLSRHGLHPRDFRTTRQQG
ncbi:MAG: sigma-54-dependent Fis family transcriptional regulator [Altererythrobacter sp.]|nr:sigma-54-dependent Fis family transcriptional regulator [Altererythrobacter sp.]